MINELNWNKERWRTRDRLLEYDFSLFPPHPHIAGLSMIYPWENNFLDDLKHQLYLIAASTGYIGDEETFIKLFGSFMNNKQILFASFSTFPQMGDYNVLYFDIDEKILYYWDNEYIPVNAMLIANTTLEGGGA